MTRPGIISSQLLLNYEQRMTNSVASSLDVLARDINASWAPDPMPFVAGELLKWRNVLADLIVRFNEAIIRESGRFIIEIIGRKNEQLEFLLNFIRPELRRYGRDRAEAIERYLRDRINGLIAAGGSPNEVRDAILRIVRNRDYARRIARTEAHTALERGSFEAARSFGVRILKEWVSRELITTRPAHARAHGQIQELEDPFSVGGEALMFPGDPTASARNVVNCLCTVRYQLP